MWKPIWRKRPERQAEGRATQCLTDEELIQRVAQEIVDRRLAPAALFLLEASRPVSFIASQGLAFLAPFVDAALDVPEYEAFVRMIEKRESIEKLLVRIEELEEQRLASRRGRHHYSSEQEEPSSHAT